MEQLAETCERIAATTKKSEKVAILGEYFRSRELADGATSAVFLSGQAFPAFEERTLQVGGALLWRMVSELADASEVEVRAAYRKHGDLGSAACEVLTARQSFRRLPAYRSGSCGAPSTRLQPRGPLPRKRPC